MSTGVFRTLKRFLSRSVLLWCYTDIIGIDTPFIACMIIYLLYSAYAPVNCHVGFLYSVCNWLHRYDCLINGNCAQCFIGKSTNKIYQ